MTPTSLRLYPTSGSIPPTVGQWLSGSHVGMTPADRQWLSSLDPGRTMAQVWRTTDRIAWVLSSNHESDVAATALDYYRAALVIVREVPVSQDLVLWDLLPDESRRLVKGVDSLKNREIRDKDQHNSFWSVLLLEMMPSLDGEGACPLSQSWALVVPKCIHALGYCASLQDESAPRPDLITPVVMSAVAHAAIWTAESAATEWEQQIQAGLFPGVSMTPSVVEDCERICREAATSAANAARCAVAAILREHLSNPWG